MRAWRWKEWTGPEEVEGAEVLGSSAGQGARAEVRAKQRSCRVRMESDGSGHIERGEGELAMVLWLGGKSDD